LRTENPVRARALAILSTFVLAVCVLLTHPVLEMGLNDDFAYIRTTLDFVRTGHIIFNGWEAAMLGWQILWGALFIKLFGFSFTVVRFSVFLLSIFSTYLLHRTMTRFGINAWNATMGTLIVVLSPLFLPLAFSFMSDIPGLFTLLLCLYACVRAVQSTSHRAALYWLCFAGISNLIGGTVRQIAWLGVLVMVPSTAWLLRRRRGALLMGAILWSMSMVAIFLSMHWFKRQPYTIPTQLVGAAVDRQALHLFENAFLRSFLSILLFCLPVLVAFLPRVFALPRRFQIFFWGSIAANAGLLLAGQRKHRLNEWLLPWLGNTISTRGLVEFGEVLGLRPVVLHGPMRLLLTMLVAAAALACMACILARPRVRIVAADQAFQLSWREIALLLGPFTLAYVVLLAPSAAFYVIFDRYLLPLVPILLIVLLRYYQEYVPYRLPAISVVLMVIFAGFGVAGTHDLFAMDQARLAAADELRSTGVPRTAIQAGFEYDGWTQLDAWGYLNDPRIERPAGAYHPMEQQTPLDGCQYGFERLTPAVDAEYVLAYDGTSCFQPSPFPPVAYRTWLPPYSQRIHVLQVHK
jgi:hypothetical protein